MQTNTDETTDESVESNDTPAVDVREEITCTLTDGGMDERLAWAEANLVPHLDRVETRSDGFSMVFDRTPAAYTAVSEMAWKESQCCSWATFAVELPDDEETVRWNARATSEEGLSFFLDSLDDHLGDGVEVIDTT